MATKAKELPDGLADAEDKAPGDKPGEQDAGGQPNRTRKLVLVGAAALLALGGGGGAYMWMVGGEAPAAAAETPDNFVDIPPMTVNLRTADGDTRFLKVHLMLVPGKAENAEITKRLPLIIDSYQPFLRELRPEDLSGSAATFRLKEEMLVRANAVLGAGSVRDVLIQDLIQQ